MNNSDIILGNYEYFVYHFPRLLLVFIEQYSCFSRIDKSVVVTRVRYERDLYTAFNVVFSVLRITKPRFNLV